LVRANIERLSQVKVNSKAFFFTIQGIKNLVRDFEEVVLSRLLFLTPILKFIEEIV
jgi:hypothetical protein